MKVACLQKQKYEADGILGNFSTPRFSPGQDTVLLKQFITQ